MAELQLARGPQGNQMALPPAYKVPQTPDPKLDKVVDGKWTTDGVLKRLQEYEEIMNRPARGRREKEAREDAILEHVAPHAQVLADEIITDTRLPTQHRVLALQILGKLGKLAAPARDTIERLANGPHETDKAVREEARKVLRNFPAAPPFRTVPGVRR